MQVHWNQSHSEARACLASLARVVAQQFPYIGFDARDAATVRNAVDAAASNGQAVLAWRSVAGGLFSLTLRPRSADTAPTYNSTAPGVVFSGGKILYGPCTLPMLQRTLYVVYTMTVGGGCVLLSSGLNTAVNNLLYGTWDNDNMTPGFWNNDSGRGRGPSVVRRSDGRRTDHDPADPVRCCTADS